MTNAMHPAGKDFSFLKDDEQIEPLFAKFNSH